MATTRERVSRSAYGRPRQHHDAILAEVGPGTPCGELMRRYWHPIAASAEATETPRMVRVLGEDLVLFRDRAGRPGLVYPRCMHRGTSLYYGHVEERGIRCCYHGWLYDVNGTCLEQPLEPKCGINKEVAAQPSYVVEERYGLVFAYMGPPDRQPVLPRYDTLEELAPDEFVQVDTTGFVTVNDVCPDPSVPYNWLQHFENFLDPGHLYVLHQAWMKSGDELGVDALPKGRFDYIDGGVKYTRYLRRPNGQTVAQSTVLRLPNVSFLPHVTLNALRGGPPGGQMAMGRGSVVLWHVPIDDTHLRVVMGMRTSAAITLTGMKQYNGKTFNDASEAERRAEPSDFEAQVGQGPITLHSEEHLVTSDRGVIMLRRLLKQQIEAVARGESPRGVAFDREGALVQVDSGNALCDAVPPELASFAG